MQTALTGLTRSVVNGVGRVIRRIGVRWPTLDAEEFLAAAQRRTGLSDWGDNRLQQGLRTLVESFDSQDSAHTFGRFFFREFCVRQLINRLRVQDDLNRHQQIREVPIHRPLFITGLPRSGTTLLHRLLSQSPLTRPLLFWETLEPSPPPESATARTDPRIARARKAIRELEVLAPRLRAAHVYEPEAPEECNLVFAQIFSAAMLAYMFDAPGYIEWLKSLDRVANYRYLKAQLQLLSWKCPGHHWVLKAPAHLFSLDAIMTIFPDACFVVAHRDPLECIPSACSLAAAYREITCHEVDLIRLAAEVSEVLAVGVDWALEARASIDPLRFFDVSYPQLLADPIGVSCSIHQHFGYEVDSSTVDRMRAWLTENPQGKQGVHHYTLRQFGLESSVLSERFAGYRAWTAQHVRPDPCRVRLSQPTRNA
jgi:Sulfotransferase family